MRRALAVLVPALMLVFIPAGSPLAGASTLGLGEAVKTALEKNDLVIAEKAKLDMARSDITAARSNFLPRVSFEERYLRTDNPAYAFSSTINQGVFSGEDLAGAPGSFNEPDAVGDFQTSLTMKQPLYSRRVSLGLKMSKSEAEAAGYDLERRREEIAHEVYRAYLGALAVEAFLETTKIAEEDADEHLRLAGLMEETETGLLSDRLRAEVALAVAKRKKLTVENDLKIARRGLGLVMGSEEPVTPTAEGLFEEAAGLDVFLTAVENRSDILAMETRVGNGARNVKLAGAERLPEVGLFGSLQANDPDTPFGTSGTSYLVGVGLSWNIFDGRAAAAGKTKAKAELERAESFLRGMQKEARYRVREAFLRVGEAKENLGIAEGALQTAVEGARLVRVRYENGLAKIVTLLDAQTALNMARSDVVKMRLAYYGSIGELRYRAGTILKDLGVPTMQKSAGEVATGGISHLSVN